MKTMRITVWIFAGFVALMAAAVLIGGDKIPWNRFFGGSGGGQPVAAAFDKPFEVIDFNGNKFDQDSLKGKPSAIFFGYTFCPDVCPNTLSEASDWMEALGKDADKVRIIFVTVDPERDTKQKVKDYLDSFDERFLGLTGTKEQVASIVKAFGVFVEKGEVKDGEYLVSHTSRIYLINGQGRFAGTIGYKEETKNALSKIRRLIASS